MPRLTCHNKLNQEWGLQLRFLRHVSISVLSDLQRQWTPYAYDPIDYKSCRWKTYLMPCKWIGTSTNCEVDQKEKSTFRNTWTFEFTPVQINRVFRLHKKRPWVEITCISLFKTKQPCAHVWVTWHFLYPCGRQMMGSQSIKSYSLQARSRSGRTSLIILKRKIFSSLEM